MIEIIIIGKDNSAAAADSAAANMKKVGDQAQAQGSRLSGFFDGVKNVALGLGGAVVVGLGAAAGAGLNFNNSIEQVTAKLNAFTKDGAVTAQLLEQIKKEAASTPFAFEEMAQATGNLMSSAKAAGVPVMDLVKQAEILAASNPAQGLEGAAIALKEAAGGDFTSIIERFDLPRQRINELKAQGVPALDAVGIAMKEMGLDADLVSNMANTMQGRWSTTMDTFTNLAAQVTQPIFDAVSSSLGGFNGMLEANTPMLTNFAGQLAGAVGQAITWVTGTAIPGLISAWASIQPAIATAQAVFAALAPVVMGVMAQIQSVIMQALAFIQAFWAENGAAIMASATTTWNTVVSIITTVSGIISQVLAIIVGFINNHSGLIMAYISNAWAFISQVVTTALALIQGIVQTVLQLLQGDFSGAWETIQNMSATFVTNLVGVIETGGALLGSAVDLIIAGVTDAWDALVRAAPGIGSGIIGGIVKGVSDAAGSLAKAAADAANGALKAAKEALGIKSPSSVFAQMVGQPIAAGMALGMTQGMPMVATAAGSLASAAQGGAQSSVSLGGGVGVNLSMAQGMDQFINARVTNRVTVMARQADARGRFQ